MINQKKVKELEGLDGYSTYKLSFACVLTSNIYKELSYDIVLSNTEADNLNKLLTTKIIEIEEKGMTNIAITVRNDDLLPLHVGISNVCIIEHTIPNFKENLQ